jgi:hypothetical protein
MIEDKYSISHLQKKLDIMKILIKMVLEVLIWNQNLFQEL